MRLTRLDRRLRNWLTRLWLGHRCVRHGRHCLHLARLHGLDLYLRLDIGLRHYLGLHLRRRLRGHLRLAMRQNRGLPLSLDKCLSLRLRR